MPANRFAGWAERSVNAGPTIVVTRPQCFGWVARMTATQVMRQYSILIDPMNVRGAPYELSPAA